MRQLPHGQPSPVVRYVVAHAPGFTAAAAERGGLDRFVSASDLSRASRLVAPGDAGRVLAARALARLLSARVLGLAPVRAAGLPGQVALCRSCGGPHGKPGLAGVSVNWSHSGEWVMAAASAPSAGGVGVDLERIPQRLFDGFDAHCLSPGESKALAPADVAGRMHLWVAKEALLKARGHGLLVPPAAVRTGPFPAIDPLTAAGADPRALDGLSMSWVPAPDGYAAAVACRRHLPVERLAPVRLFEG